MSQVYPSKCSPNDALNQNNEDPFKLIERWGPQYYNRVNEVKY